MKIPAELLPHLQFTELENLYALRLVFDLTDNEMFDMIVSPRFWPEPEPSAPHHRKRFR